MIIETVKIKDGDDYAVINKADFDATIHTLFDAEPAKPPAREDIASMSKKDVREWLEAHGAEIPKGATVDDMREKLTAVMFSDI